MKIRKKDETIARVVGQAFQPDRARGDVPSGVEPIFAWRCAQKNLELEAPHEDRGYTFLKGRAYNLAKALLLNGLGEK